MSAAIACAIALALSYGVWRWSDGRGAEGLFVALFGIPAILVIGIAVAFVLTFAETGK